MRGRLVAAGLLAVLAAGCVNVPDAGDFDFSTGEGDTATFVINGGTFQVRESGTIEISGTGVEGLDYSGPLGCDGQYFETDYTDNTQLLFRYSAVDAVLAWGSGNSHHFPGPPRVRDGRLRWHADGLDVTVACPKPTDTTPLQPPG